MGRIYYIMGKSATGKDTIYQILNDTFLDLQRLVLYTTRPIRVGEVEGVDYHFTDYKNLQKFQLQGKLIEIRKYDTMDGIWYYATVDDGKIDLEKYSYLAIGTLVSYQDILAYFGEEYIIPIYIEVEDGERLSRALERERKQKKPKYTELCRRFLADEIDFSNEKLKSAKISHKYINQNLEDVIKEIIKDIKRWEKG